MVKFAESRLHQATVNNFISIDSIQVKSEENKCMILSAISPAKYYI